MYGIMDYKLIIVLKFKPIIIAFAIMKVFMKLIVLCLVITIMH